MDGATDQEERLAASTAIWNASPVVELPSTPKMRAAVSHWKVDTLPAPPPGTVWLRITAPSNTARSYSLPEAVGAPDRTTAIVPGSVGETWNSRE